MSNNNNIHHVADLQLLAEIQKHESLTKVSKSLDLTQSAVSQRVRRAERELGFKLITKVGNKILLTEEGIILASFWDKFNSQLINVEYAIDGIRDGLTQTIRIACIPPAVHYITSAIYHYYEHYPDIKVICEKYHPEEVYDKIVEGYFQLALTMHHADHKNIIKTHLNTEFFGFYARKDHPLTRKKNIQFCDLVNMKYVAMEASIKTTKYLNKFFSQNNTAPCIQYIVHDISNMIALLAKTDLISVESSYYLRPAIEAGDIVKLDVDMSDYPVMTYDWCLLRNKERELTQLDHEFADFIIKDFPKD